MDENKNWKIKIEKMHITFGMTTQKDIVIVRTSKDIDTRRECNVNS